MRDRNGDARAQRVAASGRRPRSHAAAAASGDGQHEAQPARLAHLPGLHDRAGVRQGRVQVLRRQPRQNQDLSCARAAPTRLSRPALLQSTTMGLSGQQTFIPQKTYLT